MKVWMRDEEEGKMGGSDRIAPSLAAAAACSLLPTARASDARDLGVGSRFLGVAGSLQVPCGRWRRSSEALSPNPAKNGRENRLNDERLVLSSDDLWSSRSTRRS
jgi:hypothetical protein